MSGAIPLRYVQIAFCQNNLYNRCLHSARHAHRRAILAARNCAQISFGSAAYVFSAGVSCRSALL